jgi:hypothetical protein
MADYQLTATDVVIRNEDGANIPNDPANRERQEYDKWIADGGVPDPYLPLPTPQPVPPVDPAQNEVLFDHENRIRALAGDPPLTVAEFLQKTGL